MFKGWIKRFLSKILAEDLRELKQEMNLKIFHVSEAVNGRQDHMMMRLHRIEGALQALHLGGEVKPGGGSWVVLGYKVGERSYVTFYDLSDHNMGAMRSLLEKFEKAGIATFVKSPFHPTPRRKA